MDSAPPRSRFTKVLLGIVGVVFLGAIGSGLWERVLSPAVDWGYRTAIGAFGKAATRYVDHLYSKVGYGLHERDAATLFAFVALTIVVVNLGAILWLVWLQNRLRTGTVISLQSIRLPVWSWRRPTFWIFLLMCAFNAVAYSESVLDDTYSFRTVVWTERSLEIVRPQIPDTEFVSLRAQYRSTEDARSFRVLWIRLTTIAAQHRIVLPKFVPVGM